MQVWSSSSLPRVPGSPPPLRLYDTVTARPQVLAPSGPARMYVCGITPYDATHLGHAATYLAFDLVHRFWLDAGHSVHYVQNVTDIDDPLLARARRDGEDWRQLADREIELFQKDMAALRILPPTEFVGAVESIPEIVEAVAKLLANGAAYRIADERYPDIYFAHDATGRFGQLSGFDQSTMGKRFAEQGGDPQRVGKRHPLDALLWRMARPAEPAWESELGAGRPGWHIECAVIAANRLGFGFELQGGGCDLIFPHHEYSAAHAEALAGSHPFAQHYAHTGMIGLGGAKMSKSRENLVLVSKLREDGVDSAAVRLALLAGHYRANRPWTEELLAQAQNRLHRWRTAAAKPSGPPANKVIAQVRERLADDLDTPGALAAVDTWAENAIQGGGPDTDAPAMVRDSVDALLGVRL